MQTHTQAFLKTLDARDLSFVDTLRELRRLTLDEFGEALLHMPSPEYPHLSRVLPKMASTLIQHKWTGSSGEQLLKQSASFMGFVCSSYADITGRSLRGATALDFGCGWGRLLRLALYYIEPEKLFGCDAWDSSLMHVSQSNIPAQIRKSDTSPERLPFEDVCFDLVYAFSIFTHLPPSIAADCMSAFRRSISEDGLAIITMRPLEFWDNTQSFSRPIDSSALKHDHVEHGFAFLPPVGSSSDAPYGDASISRDYIERNWTDWSIERMGRTLVDPYQVFVCLRPR